ncbi:MAG: S-methyl-5-thioribose-1-phosphate isomerase [Candidatus Eisenbacteria bacterium]|nr:S-methyl-5-thioribose-1-phosphate isomerase [Candidatus Eisenbacteria bacterium]
MTSPFSEPRTIEWTGTAVKIIDQTILPGRLRYLELSSAEETADAIRTMKVRGAPAIGVVAALGVALSVRGRGGSSATESDAAKRALDAIELLRSTRPTAVNLAWALERMRGVVGKTKRSRTGGLKEALLSEALSIMEEDKRLCRRIGENGARLLRDGSTVLTHCNAGALATAGMGTALAVIYVAVSQGKKIRVIADETRPLLQGARLTAWELVAREIDVTVVCDSAAAWLMKQGKVDCVLVGADRVARNGDVANKIGSYSLAIVAKEHGIPFYVACPYSTIDESLPDGSSIPVEERGEEEIRLVAGKKVVPDKARVYNPAFDIVPHDYVAAIVTDRDVTTPPFEGKLGIAGG